jgi:hypothetical protein
MSYVTVQEFLSSPYGADFQPGEDCSVFASTGDVLDFLEYISSLIDLYAGQTFGTGVIEEEFIGKSNQNRVYLRKFPLHEIISIKYNLAGYSSLYKSEGYNTGQITLDPLTYGFFKDGRVIFRNSLFSDAVYQVEYIAGYQEIPKPIKMATLMLANTYAQSVDTGSVAIPEGGAITRFVFNKFESNYVDPRQRYDDMNIGIPVTIQAILNRYKFLK